LKPLNLQHSRPPPEARRPTRSPVEEAIHGVAVFEAMIDAAASGSSYAVA
jgi:hypothetical protein